MHDVAVVGGGPGGLYAARSLARLGLDVVLFEEHATSGDPVHCTGVMASEAFDEFELPRASILNELRTVRFVSPHGHVITYTTPTSEALVVDRLVFDRQLFESAASAGVRLVVGRRVTDAGVGPFSVQLVLDDGTHVESRACVLACGANYTLQRRLGLGLPQLFLQSAQLELPIRHPGDVEVYFGRSVAPNGFGWVVPVQRPGGPCARIGVMAEQDAAGCFGRLVHAVGERLGIDPDREALRPRRKVLPLAPIDRSYTDRVLAIGDAAGIVKGTTGGGIHYSVVSAAHAAAVLGEALADDALDARALARYEHAWRARLGAEIGAQIALRELAHRMDDADMEALFELARTDGVMPIVRATARFNQHREVILALFKHPPVRRILATRLRGASRLLHAAD